MISYTYAAFIIVQVSKSPSFILWYFTHKDRSSSFPYYHIPTTGFSLHHPCVFPA